MTALFFFTVIFTGLCLFTAAPAPAPVLVIAPVAEPQAEVIAWATVTDEQAGTTTILVAKAAAKRPTVAELRKACTKAGIVWRNAHGKSLHLKQGEMIAALGL